MDEESAKIIIELSPQERTANNRGDLNKPLEKIRAMPEQEAKSKGFSLIWKIMHK